MSEICHAATIATTKILAAGKVEQPVVALLARIEELENEAEKDALEVAWLRAITEVAQEVVDYHKAGMRVAPFDHEPEEKWCASVMRGRIDDLAHVLARAAELRRDTAAGLVAGRGR